MSGCRELTRYPSTMDLAVMGSSVLDPYGNMPPRKSFATISFAMHRDLD
jgi:hypothetical protein